MAQETQIGALYQPRGVGLGGREEGVSGGRGICIPMADSQRRQWRPTLVLLPGESQGWRSMQHGGLQSMGSLRVGHD